MTVSRIERRLWAATLLVSCALLFPDSALPNDLGDADGATEAPGGHLSTIMERGKLVMLCFPHQESNRVRPKLEALRELGIPLKDLRDPHHFEGSDVDLMRDFTESLGVKLEIRSITTSYADLIPALLAGDGDVIVSSITITEEREKMADFSIPYATSWVAVVVPAGNKITSIEELAGKVGAVMKGSSQLEFLRAMGPKDVELLLTNFTLENYMAVDEGEADFTLVDSEAEIGAAANANFPDLRVAFRLREFYYGVVAPPGSDLLGPLNAFLAERSGS